MAIRSNEPSQMADCCIFDLDLLFGSLLGRLHSDDHDYEEDEGEDRYWRASCRFGALIGTLQRPLDFFVCPQIPDCCRHVEIR